jgi:glycosyltransferase involved in cell wall biosynthesis
MKILLIHNYYRYRGGEDRYAVTLKETLSKKGHCVTQFSLDSKAIKEFGLLDKLLIPKRLIHSTPVNRQIKELLEKDKPDLAIIHNLFPLLPLSILKILKKHRIPVVKRIENYRFLCLNGLFLRNGTRICDVCKDGNFIPGIIHRCYQDSLINSVGMAIPLMITGWRKTLLSTVDLFLSPSRFVKNKFVEVGFPEEKIAVLPNFLDFEPLDTIRGPEPYAIFIGRLSEEKGVHTLLKAFKKFPDLNLKILGEGPMGKELKSFATSSNMQNIEFTGFIDGEKKLDILSRARFLVFPSECYESFGYSIIESHACGVPVIAASIGGAKELIDEGENGFLFEPGKVDDLEAKIAHLLTMDKQALMKMKQRSLEGVKALYTKETGYRNLVELFEKIRDRR